MLFHAAHLASTETPPTVEFVRDTAAAGLAIGLLKLFLVSTTVALLVSKHLVNTLGSEMCSSFSNYMLYMAFFLWFV